MSDDLISALAADLRPVSRLAVARRLAIGLGAGALVSAALTGLTLGFRPDMVIAAGEAMFWVKLAYTVGLCGLAIWTCERLARPGAVAQRRAAWLLAPPVVVAVLAGWQIGQAPPAMRMPMLMGGSAALCPWCIAAFSLPPLAGVIWAMRGLAPTRFRVTGLLLGLAAGGAGASAYALHCTESTAPFLAVWYTVGIAAVGLLGLLAGPRLLRW